MDAPIIFIHYGDSEYLKYTLNCAKQFNKNKKVYLLGDSENKHYAGNGIHHINFSSLHYGKDIKDFERGFKIIKGKLHEFNKHKGTDFWLKFVFLRWFYINNFIIQNKIKSFWTFDTDTLIISELSKFEGMLSEFDCTEQCTGSCLNGLILKTKVVDDYINHINYLFRDKAYLKEQQEEFIKNEKFAFTEMRAYLSFKQSSGLISKRLSTVIKGEFFDDCLCHEEGMEMIKLLDGHFFKKLYQDKVTKALYVLRRQDHTFLKVNTINLSWLSTYITEDIFGKVVPHRAKIIHSKEFYKLEPLLFKNDYFAKIIRKFNLYKLSLFRV